MLVELLNRGPLSRVASITVILGSIYLSVLN